MHTVEWISESRSYWSVHRPEHSWAVIASCIRDAFTAVSQLWLHSSDYSNIWCTLNQPRICLAGLFEQTSSNQYQKWHSDGTAAYIYEIDLSLLIWQACRTDIWVQSWQRLWACLSSTVGSAAAHFYYLSYLRVLRVPGEEKAASARIDRRCKRLCGYVAAVPAFNLVAERAADHPWRTSWRDSPVTPSWIASQYAVTGFTIWQLRIWTRRYVWYFVSFIQVAQAHKSLMGKIRLCFLLCHSKTEGPAKNSWLVRYTWPPHTKLHARQWQCCSWYVSNIAQGQDF